MDKSSAQFQFKHIIVEMKSYKCVSIAQEMNMRQMPKRSDQWDVQK